MNMRIALHVVAAVATALAGGTIVFAGVSDIVTKDIAAIATLIGIAVNAYLAPTSTGVAK